MPNAYDPYARYLEDICPEIGKRQHPFTLYCRWTKQWSKKGEAGERGKKYTEETSWRIKTFIRKKMLHLFLKPAHLSVETCYIFFWKVLCLFEKNATPFQADRSYYWCVLDFSRQLRLLLLYQLTQRKYMSFGWRCHNLFFHDYLKNRENFMEG